MKIFLKLKHWQIFLLAFIPSIWYTQIPTLSIILQLFGGTIFYLWIISIGIYGNASLRKENKVVNRGNFFYVIRIFPLFVLLYMFGILNEIELNNMFGNLFEVMLLAISIPLFFGGLYILYFVAIVIGSLESQSGSKRINWFFTMLLLLGYIVGVWYIQPKVNRYLGTN